DPVFVNVLAGVVWRNTTAEDLFDAAVANREHGEIWLMDAQGGYRSLWSEIDGEEASEPAILVRFRSSDGEPNDVAGPADLASHLEAVQDTELDPSRSLTLMRRTMAKAELGRIVVGGKVIGYGMNRPTARPGLPEEALESLKAGRLVLPIGTFGGAAHDIAVAMGLLEPLVHHDDVGPNYHETIAEIREMAPRCLEQWSTWGISSQALRLLAREDVPAAIATIAAELFDRFRTASGRA
ncbi:MAG: hypothetical protein AAF602_20345, partial [Myxococcota bacterium]